MSTKQSVRCEKCGHDYFCMELNTTFFGPIIETTCPKCNNIVSRNLSAFIESQVDAYSEMGVLSRACKMINFSLNMGIK